MSDFKVTTGVLRQQADELTELNGNFKSSIEKLVSSEASLNSMWDGEANDAFHAAFDVDKAKMDEFYTVIMQYIERLRLISDRYDQTEQTNTEIASNRNY